MIDEKRIKRFIEGAKEAFKEVDEKTFIFPMTILSAYELATSIEELLKEKEAVEPFHRCIGKNFSLIDDSYFDYCPYCGKPITWAKQEDR